MEEAATASTALTEAEVDALKETANEAFKGGRYEDAIQAYSSALGARPDWAVVLANRSLAYLRTELYGLALEDATAAIKADPAYLKGFYRRAAAYFALGKFKPALRDYEAVHKARPKDPDAKAKFQEVSKLVRRLQFERAIRCDSADRLSPLEAAKAELETLAVPDDYDGPRLPDDGSLSPEFMRELMKTLRAEGKLHKRYATQILIQAYELFEASPTMVDISIPPGGEFTVCGDVHGQYYDLLNIFELNGAPSAENPYLFNGDFVDRGSFSVETILTLLGFKLLYPEHFFMSRGNHESETMNQMYGFFGEVKSKYSEQMAQFFTDIYNRLPLCHLIEGRILVTHGGLFKQDGVKLADIRAVERVRQPPEEGIMCDLLWSDPMPGEGRAPSKRGVGIQFGPDVTRDFCADNGLDYVVRSHEVKPDGYEVAHEGRCVTVFSAPNYCDSMGNKGALIRLSHANGLKPVFTTFDAVPHPNVRPMAYGASVFNFL